MSLFETAPQSVARSIFSENKGRLRRYPNLPYPKQNGWHQMMAVAWRAHYAGADWMSEDYDPEECDQ